MAHPSTVALRGVNEGTFARLARGRYNRTMWWRPMMMAVWLTLGWPAGSPAAEPVMLEVRTDPSGGVRAVATVVFPAPLPLVRELLTDYAHWPEFFEVPMRVAALTIDQGVATVDVRITHALLPVERRLVTESRALSDRELVSDLKGGDFRRYQRRWVLSPIDQGLHTKGEFELLVEIDSMVPDWVIAAATKRDLEAHFRIVREKCLARVMPEK